MSKCIEMVFPSFFSILTADVRYNKNLTANEKILFSEITALTNSRGYCSASNKYFSELYNVDSRTIQRWISNLVKYGFISLSFVDGVRYIYITLGKIPPKKKKNQVNSSVPSWFGDYVKNFDSTIENL